MLRAIELDGFVAGFWDDSARAWRCGGCSLGLRPRGSHHGCENWFCHIFHLEKTSIIALESLTLPYFHPHISKIGLDFYHPFAKETMGRTWRHLLHSRIVQALLQRDEDSTEGMEGWLMIFMSFPSFFPSVNPKIWGNLLGKVALMFLMPPKKKPWWHRGDLSWDIASFAWLKIRKKLVCWLFFVSQRDSITFSWHFNHFKSRWAHGLLTHTHTHNWHLQILRARGATSMQRTAVILNLWVISASVDTRMICRDVGSVGFMGMLAFWLWQSKPWKRQSWKQNKVPAHHANHLLSLTSLLCTWLGLDSCGLDLIPGEVYKTLCYARCKWKEYELQSVWQMRKSGCRRRWGLKWH